MTVNPPRSDMNDPHPTQKVIQQAEPIRKQIYEHLRKEILSQKVQPASRLVESQIAAEYGISRTPVREAFHLLEKDGFIEAIPRVGYRVRHLDWDELEDIFELRRVNESLACRWAIKRMGPKTLRLLEENIAHAHNALKKKKPDHFLTYDGEFHEILAEAAGSRHLFELCQQLRRLMLRYRVASIKTIETMTEALRGHEKMLLSLRNGDEQGLVDALRDHLERSKEDISRNRYTTDENSQSQEETHRHG
ncbi:MAG: GntR family transcriptional regulator [Desulfopila sp.]